MSELCNHKHIYRERESVMGRGREGGREEVREGERTVSSS